MSQEITESNYTIKVDKRHQHSQAEAEYSADQLAA